MAQLNFKMGVQSRMLETSPVIAPGTVYVTADERAMYIDVPAGVVDGKQAHRIRLGDFRTYESFEALKKDKTDWSQSCLYYVEDKKALVRYNGTEWVLINDTSHLSTAIQGLADRVTALEEGYNAIIDPTNGILAQAKAYADAEDKKIEDLLGTAADGKDKTTAFGKIAANADSISTNAGAIATLKGQVQDLEGLVGGNVGELISEAIGKLDANKTSAAVEAGKGLQVQVVEVDGKITEVNVTGNFDNKYDVKGAASAAQSAVEGQLTAYQQDMSAIIKGLEGEDDKLSKRIEEVNGYLGGETDLSAALTRATNSAVATAKDYTDTEVKKVSDKAGENASQIQSLSEQLGTAKQTITTQGQAIDALKEDTKVGGTIDGRINAAKEAAITQAGNNADDKISTFKTTEISPIKTDVQGLKDLTTTQGTQITGLTTTTGEHTTKLAGLSEATVQASINKAKEEAIVASNGVAGDLSALTQRVSTNENDIDDLSDRIDGVVTDYEAADTALGQRIDGINTKLGDFTDATTVRAYVDGLDAAQTGALNKAKEDLTGAISQASKDASDLVAAEKERAIGVEGQLKAGVDANTGKLSDITGKVGETITTKANAAEANAKGYADGINNALTTKINNSVQDLTTLINNETSRAEGAEEALAGRLDDVEEQLSDVTGKVGAAITASAASTLASANSTAQEKVNALANGQVATNKSNIEALEGRMTTVEGKANSNASAISAMKEGATVTTFKGVEELIATSIATSDAMVFKGSLSKLEDLPKTGMIKGDTYKVAVALDYLDNDHPGTYIGDATSAKVGDLFIWDGAEWKHIPSGGEDYSDPALSSANNVITLTSGVTQNSIGNVTIVGATDGTNNDPENSQLVRVSGSDNKIVIALEWGTF